MTESKAKTPVKPRSKPKAKVTVEEAEKPPHRGTENLIPLNKRTKEEQRKIATNGGKASGIARREKKALREKLELAMNMPLRSGRITSLDKVKNFEDAKDTNMTLEDRMIMQIARKAANGDPQIYALYREEIGQKPAEKHEVKATVTVVDSKKLNDIKKVLDKNPDLLEQLIKDKNESE